MSIDNTSPFSTNSARTHGLSYSDHSRPSVDGKTSSTQPSVIRTFIAAENSTEIRRISALLNSHPDITVIGYAETAAELDAALHLRRQDLNVLISDLELQGTDVTDIICKAMEEIPALDTLCYTYHSDEVSVIRAIQAGAMGYILRGSNEDLPNCVRLIHGGGSPVSPIVARSVLRAIQAQYQQNEPRRRYDTQTLSSRETEILQLLSKGISFAEIGVVLSISPHTVTAHIKKIYKKLQVHSRGEAVYEAQCLGLLPKH